MEPVRKTLLSTLIGIAFILIGIFLLRCVFSTETKESYYENYQRALEDGAIARGWIPSWLPKSAHSINEAHDLDTNWSTLAFKFSKDHELVISRECKPIDASNIPPPYKDYKWWPQNVPPSDSRTSEYNYYKCEAGQFFLAVNMKTGIGCTWSLPR